MSQFNKELITNTHYCRGFFIDAFSHMEKDIELYISTFFQLTVIESFTMSEIVLDRLTFESKKTALKEILERQSKTDGFVKTKNKSWPFSDLIEDIRVLNVHRIYFAHYLHLPIEEPANALIPDGKLWCLVEYRNKTKVIWYGEKDFLELLEKILSVRKTLAGMIKFKPN